MTDSKIYFLVNAKSNVNLLDPHLLLLFGIEDEFRKIILRNYPNILNEKKGFLKVKSANSILSFYFENDNGVIEKFVMVDVVKSKNPLAEVAKLCVHNGWRLYDLDLERYISLEK